jgi:hypothetical protein
LAGSNEGTIPHRTCEHSSVKLQDSSTAKISVAAGAFARASVFGERTKAVGLDVALLKGISSSCLRLCPAGLCSKAAAMSFTGTKLYGLSLALQTFHKQTAILTPACGQNLKSFIACSA